MASSPAQKLIDLVYRELDEAKGLADQGFRLIGMGQRGGWTDIVGALEYSISAQTNAERAADIATDKQASHVEQLRNEAMSVSRGLQAAITERLTAGFWARLTGRCPASFGPRVTS